MEVKNAQNESLGKVDDLALRLRSGRVAGGLISSGGILGLGEKSRLVPPALFQFDPANKRLELDVTKDQFKNAPDILHVRGKDKDVYSTAEIKDSFDYFKNAANRPNQLHEVSPPPNDTELESARIIMGKRVENERGDKLGSVDNLMVDIPAGKLAEVIVSSGGFLGIGDELSVVPPAAFHISSTDNALRLDVTKEMLTSAPHFKPSEWPDLGDPLYMEKVYRAYGLQREKVGEIDNTRQNVRAPENSNVTADEQGDNKADVELAASIRREIMKHSDYSVNAQNVKIIAKGGRVTLRGPVNSEQEPRGIVDIATQVAGAKNVEDRLEIKGK
jgi:sporulation protein YlmC with PRC-barrel domain